MTEVLESKTADAMSGSGWQPEAALTGTTLANLEVPVHCGTGMALGYPPLHPRLPWDPEDSLQPEWTCACGFRLAAATTEATDPLNAVRLASARLETVQWELDYAQEMLAEALRKAAQSGADRAFLRDAANLDDDELRLLL
jgi:hypothetical protein